MIPNRITLGIDEAGRGPAIGPMVLAAVCLDSKAARSLTRAGLADSKSFGAGEEARATRARLAEKVRKVAIYVNLEVVTVDVIDQRVMHGELNVLEREVATRLIEAAPTRDKIVADGRRMFSPLAARFPELEAHDDGESVHASVAAASVIAKVLRDELFEAIRSRYVPEFGDIIGGGYVNAGTRRFLRSYCERYNDLPCEARRSWPYPYLRDLLGDRCMPVKAQLDLLGAIEEAAATPPPSADTPKSKRPSKTSSRSTKRRAS
jgi:ribonuclease HII